jgi:exopolysaccharide production protein ExoZ
MELSATAVNSPPIVEAKQKLVNVQAARGIASLLVVFFHTDSFYFGNPSYWNDTFLGHFFSFGHSGVYFFFVLSGFIIYTAHRRDIGRPAGLLAFAQKRAIRIYPFYWLCLAVALVVLFALPGFGLAKNRDPINIIGSIFLAGINPLNATIFVSWTLFYEMLFYGMFAILILSSRVGWIALVVWWLLCALGGIFLTDPPYPLNTINLLFAMGIGTAMALRQIETLPGLFLTIAGTALFLGTGVDEVFLQFMGPITSVLGYGLGSALALAGLVELERKGKFKAPAIMVLAGEASYAIYLTHMLALAFGAKLLRLIGAPHWMPILPAFILIVLAGSIIGTLAHLWVEKPLLRISRKMIVG